MLRRITRNKQLTIPKEIMDRLHLSEGDYVSIEYDDAGIHLRPVVINEFSNDDYEKLAAKLDQIKKEEPGMTYNSSDSARNHLKSLMK